MEPQVRHLNYYTKWPSVLVWGYKWTIFMLGWFWPIHLIHWIRQKSVHFGKTRRSSDSSPLLVCRVLKHTKNWPHMAFGFPRFMTASINNWQFLSLIYRKPNHRWNYHDPLISYDTASPSRVSFCELNNDSKYLIRFASRDFRLVSMRIVFAF